MMRHDRVGTLRVGRRTDRLCNMRSYFTTKRGILYEQLNVNINACNKVHMRRYLYSRGQK